MTINSGLFKAYDVRGVYPGEINEGAVCEISRTLGKFFKRGTVVLGRDARISSPRLYNAARNALLENKSMKILAAGMITTPELYFLVNYFKANGGIMITASHNPPKYNGMKVVGAGAGPISGEDVRRYVKTQNAKVKSTSQR